MQEGEANEIGVTGEVNNGEAIRPWASEWGRIGVRDIERLTANTGRTGACAITCSPYK